MTDSWESTRRMVCGHKAYPKGEIGCSWYNDGICNDEEPCCAQEYVTLAEMEYRLTALRAEYIKAEEAGGCR